MPAHSRQEVSVLDNWDKKVQCLELSLEMWHPCYDNFKNWNLISLPEKKSLLRRDMDSSDHKQRYSKNKNIPCLFSTIFRNMSFSSMNSIMCTHPPF